MSILTWNDQLLVGIESVDDQHKQLVVLINRLDEVVALGAEPQTVVDTVNELVDYTVYHFRHEEELMQQASFNPQYYSQHFQEHKEFVEKMQQVQSSVISNISILSKELLDFLVDWLCRHILKTDKLMALSLNQGVDASQVVVDREEQVDILHSNLYSALRESEDRFKELSDHLPALIWVTNAKNAPIFCNRFWYQTFGFEQGSLDKKRWLNAIHEDDRQQVAATYEKAASELSKFRIEYRLQPTANQVIWILETAVPRMRQNGGFAGLMGCGMDITSQKQAEEVLAKVNLKLEQQVNQRTEALTQANKTLEQEKNQQTLLNQQLKETQGHLIQSEKMASIGQLAAGVAHEINNPLGYIYSNLNSLKRYIQDLTRVAEIAANLSQQLPADNGEVQAFKQLKQSMDLDFVIQDAVDLVDESLEGASRAKKIVQDLRDFSRIDKQEREMFDIEAGIDATLNIVHNEIKMKAEVVKQYAGLKPLECVGAQLNQVFMNMLVNAAQAIDGFGKITIATGYLDDSWLWVEFSDTGKGMSDEVKNKIFDPFFTTKPVGMGTGLGLSLSYKIIKDHQGRIEVESQPNQGTRFRIYLPIQTSE